MIPTPLQRIGLSKDRVEALLRPHAKIAREAATKVSQKPATSTIEGRLEREVKRLKKKGETELQIARALHVTRAVVVQILQPQKKGRGGQRGEHFKTKLTENQVRNIRKRYDDGDPLQAIADYYGVTKACISLIGSRQKRGSVQD